MKFAKRVDSNHAEIRDGLRTAGYQVRDHSKCGDGIPDLCVLIQPGLSLHLEVKDLAKYLRNKSKGELTEAEKEWMSFNAWNTRKVFTLEEAVSEIVQFKLEVGSWKPSDVVSRMLKESSPSNSTTGEGGRISAATSRRR